VSGQATGYPGFKLAEIEGLVEIAKAKEGEPKFSSQENALNDGKLNQAKRRQTSESQSTDSTSTLMRHSAYNSYENNDFVARRQ
jgi:hypothetical protein